MSLQKRKEKKSIHSGKDKNHVKLLSKYMCKFLRSVSLSIKVNDDDVHKYVKTI